MNGVSLAMPMISLVAPSATMLEMPPPSVAKSAPHTNARKRSHHGSGSNRSHHLTKRK
ncbi:MAG: hypothetical protein U0169_12625 [Polyangiaceae bacterium]